MPPIRKLLIANRGEIARRIQGTCRALGIDTVAVYSEADVTLPFVREADEAYCLGPAPAIDSYLRQDRVLEVARQSGVDAIHPGYGFLAENPEFAAAVTEAGLVFVGPTAEVIRAMGLKHEARRLAERAGIPLLPGYDEEDQSPARLASAAAEIGFPVLLKPTAGGGGKGMRIVRELSALASSVETSKREALRAFGDDRLLVERYVECPRHVEFQILGDAHGNVIHLFERECSIQRRYQKIVEETPSPALEESLRERIGTAAVALARGMAYRSAGTVEFLLGPDGAFYFLEVNTRLQVEHPVTECVTGLDLVAEQIRIAEGEPLSIQQSDVLRRGAALEVRLYAEDPVAGFLPSTGRIVDYVAPSGPGIRVDGGVDEGSDVSVHYDPLLAKIIAHGSTRSEARRLLSAALRRTSVVGVRTNREFLVRLLEDPEFIGGRTHTHFVEEFLRGAGLAPAGDTLANAAMAATIHGYAQRQTAMTGPRVTPGFRLDGRCRAAPTMRVDYRGPAGPVSVSYRGDGSDAGALRVWVGVDGHSIQLLDAGPRWVVFQSGVRRCSARVVRDGDQVTVQTYDATVTLDELSRFPVAGAATTRGGLTAPMPGRVLKVGCVAEESVEPGRVLVVLEAMKMEHEVAANAVGRVREVKVRPGDHVTAGQVLVVLA